jgi:magnesium transporter
LAPYKDSQKITWINISGLKDINSIKQLGEMYDIHPLTIEDVLHTEQQPKIEVFETYRFLSIKSIQQEMDFPGQQKVKLFRKKTKALKKNTKPQEDILNDLLSVDFIIDQVSIIIMKNTLITFQEMAGDSFDGIRNRILKNSGDIRGAGTDYLAYTIIDAVVDEYSVALNHLEDEIENFEDRAPKTGDSTFIEQIQDTKKYLLYIKRAVTPLRDNIATIIRHENFFETDGLKPFLQDLSEHLTNAAALVESHREWLSSIMYVNISILTYQMNKVMKVFGIISTIFIPLTFIAGVYGMNFTFMPELEMRFGYPVVLGGMGIIAFIMLIIFKIRRWF